MVNFAAFLSARGDEPLRAELWTHYQAIERYLLCDLGFRATVREVRETSSGQTAHFDPSGIIVIPYDCQNMGTLFHELTHDLFHHSVFHRNQNSINAFPQNHAQDPAFNETWGEGFCDAIRWLMECARLPGSAWLQDYNASTGTDWRIMRAERILAHTGRTLPAFAQGWTALATAFDSSADYLNRTIP